MPNLIRAFVAVPIPALPALRPVLRRLELLGSAIKPVAPENLHVTLKFLGPIPFEQVPQIAAVMQLAADRETPFTATVVGMGAFPRPERPSVVWAGLNDADGLVRMAERIEQHLLPLGFPRERRAFQPHLTLARVRRKPPAELAELLRIHQATPFGTVNIEAIQLFQSEPGPTGPRYGSLATAELSPRVC